MSQNSPGTDPPAMRPGTITKEHRYEIPVGRADVWALISSVGEYQQWWPWLRSFRAAGLLAGEEWQCEVQPPLPYPVRFQVLIDHVEPPHLVRARVEGDVIGTATLTLTGDNERCTASLVSALAPGNSTLRLVSRLASPIARFGHDWVLNSGARQFIDRAVTPTLTD